MIYSFDFCLSIHISQKQTKKIVYYTLSNEQSQFIRHTNVAKILR